MKFTANDLIETTSRARQRAALKAGEAYYNGRYWHTCSTLEEAYKQPSIAKWRAYHYCRQLCADLNGFDFIIPAYNTMTFSVLFKFLDDAGKLCYGYITRDYSSFCRAEN